MSVYNSAVRTVTKSKIVPGIISLSGCGYVHVNLEHPSISRVRLTTSGYTFGARDLRELAHELTRIAEVLEENSDG